MIMGNKVALITGASRGIGAGIAKTLAKKGYSLVLTCEKREDELNQLAKELHGHLNTEIMTHVGDISKESFVSEVASSTAMFFGRMDVIVNNAGIWEGGIINDMSLSRWNRMVAVNMTAPFLVCREFIPMMLHNKSGTIINISSMWGVRGASCEAAYSATKGGLNAFTVALAKELAPSGVTVNAIAPGVIDTDMNSSLSDVEIAQLRDQIPMCRLGTPEDIGKAVLGIIDSPYMTGQIITVDGGFL